MPELTEQKTIFISKRNPQGKETWRYQGTIIRQDANQIVLEAFFDRPNLTFHGMLLATGDRFVETYYTDRWYNIFEIHARETDALRGWYCNIATPATLAGDLLAYTDLALDLLVFPDGRQLVLDEDEFLALDISPETRARARLALVELSSQFTHLTVESP